MCSLSKKLTCSAGTSSAIWIAKNRVFFQYFIFSEKYRWKPVEWALYEVQTTWSRHSKWKWIFIEISYFRVLAEIPRYFSWRVIKICQISRNFSYMYDFHPQILCYILPLIFTKSAPHPRTCVVSRWFKVRWGVLILAHQT